MAPKEKKSKRAQLTGLVLEFLEAAVHQFLYVWKIYPPESFTKRKIYDVPVYMSRHPQLCDYIHSMLVGCKRWIHEGELEKLQVVLLTENGSILRRLTIESGWNKSLVQPSGASLTVMSAEWDQNDEPLPLMTIKDEFRAALVALTATPVTYGYRVQGSSAPTPSSFRLLAYTMEDASRPGLSLDETEPINSWVTADRYWYDKPREEQKSSDDSSELLPIRSMQGESFPLRMQLYLEDR